MTREDFYILQDERHQRLFSLNHELLPDESELLLRIADGDEQAYARFYYFYYPKLRPFVARFFADAAQAEDAMQECFIRVWLSRDQLPSIENVKGWLHTIVSRICINAIRNAGTREKHTKEHSVINNLPPDTPEEMTLAEEIKRHIEKAVEQMPPSRKRIYLMSRTEGLTPAQIADALSLSTNTVRNTLVTALKEIRFYLTRYGFVVSVLAWIGSFL